MRKKIVAGNWKMNKDIPESENLISELKSKLSNFNSLTEVIICPPFTNLQLASELTKNTIIKVGAQNMYYENSGAFTAEISADMLKSVGCKYVIIGHSERRTIFAETNQLINKKINKAINENLIPIFCIGESLNERETGETEKIIESQIRTGLEKISLNNANELIIAYEPIWAIGTGKTASPEQAEEVHFFIRKLISDIYSAEIAEKIRILYGGSVKPENASSLMSKENIDGALVGGACLKANSFFEIIKAVQ